MGDRVRSFDWSTTPLGPAESWSPSLKMMVRFVLANRFPQLLWWGPDFVQIYNDACRPILGAKHPTPGLGHSVRECWPEIWDVLRPLMETPFNGGPPTWMEDLELEINRHGFVEEAHFTIACSAVPDETGPGGVGGVLATVHEITERVVRERRTAAVRDLASRLAGATTPEQACELAANTLASYNKDVPFALIYLLDETGATARLVASAGVRRGLPISPSSVTVDASHGGPLGEVLSNGALRLVSDIRSRFGDAPPESWSVPQSGAAAIPLSLNCGKGPAGLLVVGTSPRLKVDDAYRAFLDRAKGQIEVAIANARVVQEERLAFAHKRRLYEATLSNTPDLAYVWDLNHRFIYVNEGLLKMWGRTLEDAIGKNCLELGYEPWHAAMHDREIDQVVATGQPLRGEVPFTGTFGRRIYDYVLVPVFGPDGKVEAVAGTTRDVTDYRQAQDEHRRHAQQLGVLNRVGMALAAELDLEKLVQTVTDAGRELSGAQFGAFFYNVKNTQGESYTLYSLSGVPREAFSKFPMPRNTAVFAPTFNGEGLIRIGDVLRDPRYGNNAPHFGMPTGHLPVRSYLAAPVVSRSGEVLGGLFYGHAEPDVFSADTEPVISALAAQAAIAIDNARLHRDAHDEIVQRKEAEAELSRRAARSALLSSTLEEILGSTDPQKLVHELFPRVAAHVGADAFFNFLVNDAGDALWLHACAGIPDEAARAIGRLEFGQAICGRVAMHRRAIHATDIQNSTDPAASLVRPLGIQVYFCNPLLVGDKLLGTLSIASRTRTHFEPDELEFLTTVAQYVAISMDRLQGEVRLQHLVEERTRALQETHSRLRLSERMAALGTLAAGLGHDMGNLLLPIRVQLESIEAAGVPEPVRHDVAAIRSGLEYLRKLSSGLRLLSIDPDGAGNEEVTELGPWWSEARTVLQSSLPRGIALRGDVPAGSVRMARAAFTQVVFNLVQNAGDAMRERARGAVTVSSHAGGGFVKITVADNGPGMTDEVRARCMEPFFTTKTREVSTGLGLALVYGLVQQAGGSVELLSQPGRGTTFIITLEEGSLPDPAPFPPDRRPIAIVDVRDVRVRAILTNDLRPAFSVRQSGAHADAALIVTDNPAVNPSDGAVIVVIADKNDAPAGTIVLGRGARIDAIREAVRTASRNARRTGGPQ